MNGTDQYPVHVVQLINASETRLYDQITASLLAVCLVLGTIGNAFAIIYFSTIPKRSLCEKLYLAIASVDICTCVSQSAVIPSFLNKREPMLFLSRPLCGIWVVVFEYLQRCSIFMIVLLSVSRTIAIVRPFTRIRDKLVLASILPYSLILLSDVVVFKAVKAINQSTFYSMEFGYPIKGFGKIPIPQENLTDIQVRAGDIQNWLHNMEVIIPSILIAISFFVSLIRLQTLPKATSSEKRVHDASITISLATALFLILNLPFFVMLSLYIPADGPLSNEQVLASIMWPVTKILLVTLNATMNPVLYFYRIKRFRRWLLAITFKCPSKFYGRDSPNLNSPRNCTNSPMLDRHLSKDKTIRTSPVKRPSLLNIMRAPPRHMYKALTSGDIRAARVQKWKSSDRYTQQTVNTAC